MGGSLRGRRNLIDIREKERNGWMKRKREGEQRDRHRINTDIFSQRWKDRLGEDGGRKREREGVKGVE